MVLFGVVISCVGVSGYRGNGADGGGIGNDDCDGDGDGEGGNGNVD